MCRVLISLTLTKEILSVLLGLIIRKSCNCKTEVCACCWHTGCSNSSNVPGSFRTWAMALFRKFTQPPPLFLLQGLCWACCPWPSSVPPYHQAFLPWPLTGERLVQESPWTPGSHSSPLKTSPCPSQSLSYYHSQPSGTFPWCLASLLSALPGRDPSVDQPPAFSEPFLLRRIHCLSLP